MTQKRLQTPSDEENLLLEATGVDLGAQNQFWNAVSAWVAQALRGSRSPGGSRRSKFTVLNLLCLGRAAQVGRAGSSWVAQAWNPVYAFQKSKIGLQSCLCVLGAMKLVHELCLAFYTLHKYLLNQISFQIKLQTHITNVFVIFTLAF